MQREQIESLKKYIYEICKKYDVPTSITFEKQEQE